AGLAVSEALALEVARVDLVNVRVDVPRHPAVDGPVNADLYVLGGFEAHGLLGPEENEIDRCRVDRIPVGEPENIRRCCRDRVSGEGRGELEPTALSDFHGIRGVAQPIREGRG